MEQIVKLGVHTAQSVALLCEGAVPTLEQLEAEADAEDMASVEGMSAPSRRRERLLWRRMARTLIDSRALKVEYTAEGAPKITDFPYSQISVSHCKDAVVVVASQQCCGVDIERRDRDFSRVASRYITDQEWSLSGEGEQERNLFMAVVWCAKECLYKMYGHAGIDFRRDVEIEKIDIAARSVVGRLEQHKGVEMQIELLDNHIVVLCR